MSDALPRIDGILRKSSVSGTGASRVSPARFRPEASPTSAAGVPPDPSPSFSYELLRHADRWTPSFVFDLIMRLGAWVALWVMPTERCHSRDYLAKIFGRRARLIEVWRHFFAYTKMFVLRARLAEGRAHGCRPLESCDDLKTVIAFRRPALLGTFHFGNSDLIGFLLSSFGCHVHMIRLRMESSRDTHRLADRFGKSVTFIWANDADNLLFAVKQAAQSGSSIALKCDRPEHSSKTEVFDFLGEKRRFPFAIYHLAILFRLPVVFCVGVPSGPDESSLHGSPIFEPDGTSKAENLARGRAHFQAVLTHLETLLRANPYLWFNFTRLLPAEPSRSHQPAEAQTHDALRHAQTIS